MYAHMCTHKHTHTWELCIFFYIWAEIINLIYLQCFNTSVGPAVTHWRSHCCFEVILLNATNPKLSIDILQYRVNPEKDFEIILCHFDHLVCILPTQTQQIGFPVMHLTAFTTVYAPRHQRKDVAATQQAEKQSTNSGQNAKNY